MVYFVNGIELACDDQGTGEAVVFVHGHPFNRSMWLPQVEAFRGSARVITLDLRGYGDSTLAPNAQRSTLDEFAEDMAVVLDRLGIEQATVVGLSMGGQIAMEFARAFPKRVRGLVLAATFADAETSEGMINRNRIADRILAEGMAVLGCEVLPKLIGPASMTRLPHVAANVYRMICTTNPRAAAAALRGRAMRRDYNNFLSTLHVPTLIVVGTDDAYTTVAQAEDMHRRMLHSTLEIFEGIGHMPNLEDPERFNSVLRELLKRTARHTAEV
jgi:3-oxoadipate enol-lactonase